MTDSDEQLKGLDRAAIDETAITKAKELASELRDHATEATRRDINAVIDSIIKVLAMLKEGSNSDNARAAFTRSMGVCREHRPMEGSDS